MCPCRLASGSGGVGGARHAAEGVLSDLHADRLDALLAHRAWVRAVAFALVTDENDADDVEQQTWLLAMERPPQHAASLRGWLGATARNVARKLGRGRTRRTRHEATVAPRDDSVAAADLVAEAEVQQRIGRAVLALDEPFRSTVLLRYFDGLQPAEVAARLGVPVETVRSRLRRAHERLRGRIDEESGGSRAAWAMAVLAWDAAGPLRPPGTAGTAVPTSVVVTGGLAMSMAKKVLLAAALLAAVGGAAWIVVDRSSDGRDARQIADAQGRQSPDATGHSARPKRAAPPVAPDAAMPRSHQDDLPPPVDLDAADRDLDLHGIVVDAAGGAVPGAQIATLTYPWRVAGLLNNAGWETETAGPSTRSARDGTFSLRLARGDSVALRVAADGFAAVEVPSALAGERIRVTLHPGVRLVVAFTDVSGTPIAGGSVRLFCNGESQQVVTHARGTAGADGICTLDGLPPSAEVVIDPEHPTGKGQWTQVTLPAAGELRREIRIAAGRTLAGRVVDAGTKQPIAGATVGMNWTLDMSVTTRDDGTYALPGWNAAGVSSVGARAEGWSKEEKEVGDATTLDFELHRGYAASGRVVGADGAPVAGAYVGLLATEFKADEQQTSDGYATADAQGRFRVTSLRPGMRHVIVVLAAGHARVRRETPTVATTGDLDLGDVVLPRPLRVEGVVVGGGGTPEPRVSVTLSSGKGDEQVASFYGRSVTVTTDDLGRFRFAGVAPDWYAITVRPADAQEIRSEVRVTNADVLDVRVARAATRDVRFTVTDAEGAPQAGMYVSLTSSSNQRVQARTGADGKATVQVPTAVVLRWSVQPGPESTRTFLQPPWRELRDTDAEMKVVLHEGRSLAGRVLDPDDAPVAGARLRVVGAAGEESWAFAGQDGRFRALVPSTGGATVDFAGSVLRDGRYVDSGLMGHAEAAAAGAEVVVRCTRVASDRRLTVVVVSPHGEPVAEAWVNATWGGASQGQPVKTDAAGRASLDALPAREVAVEAGFQRQEFLAPERVSVVPDGQEIRLVCRAASRITGTVADAQGRGFHMVGVQALREGKQVGFAFTDEGGRFALLLPATDTAPVRLYVDRNHDDTPDAMLDGVAPGTPDVRLVIGAPPR